MKDSQEVLPKPPCQPFQYQMTEYDCVPTTILNALRFLFPREVIPPEALITINRLGMNEKSCWCDDEKLINALKSIVDWLNRYEGKGSYKKFRVKAQIFENRAVTSAKIGKYLKRGDAAVYMGVSSSEKPEEDHATLAIFQDHEHVYFFDSYLSTTKNITKRRRHEQMGFQFFPGETLSYNIMVLVRHLYTAPMDGEDWYYRLGEEDARFCIVFQRE